MASANKKTIKTLFKALQKRNRELPELLPRNRDILELYAFTIFLENTSVTDALDTFSVLERYFIDWNEVRVSTTKELADLFNKVTEPLKAGERMRRILQCLFEIRYKFDLEDLREQTPDEVQKFFHDIPYSTSFMTACILFLMFDKSPIPLDEGSKRVLRLLECIDIDVNNKEVAPCLDLFTVKNEKLEFFILLHNLGAEIMKEENGEVLNFLQTIDPEVSVRSWLPLVESTETEDPVEIAKRLVRHEPRRVFPAMSIEVELDTFDDSFEAPTLVEEEEEIYADQEFGGTDSEEDDNEDDLTSIPKEKKSKDESLKSSNSKLKSQSESKGKDKKLKGELDASSKNKEGRSSSSLDGSKSVSRANKTDNIALTADESEDGSFDVAPTNELKGSVSSSENSEEKDVPKLDSKRKNVANQEDETSESTTKKRVKTATSAKPLKKSYNPEKAEQERFEIKNRATQNALSEENESRTVDSKSDGMNSSNSKADNNFQQDVSFQAGQSVPKSAKKKSSVKNTQDKPSKPLEPQKTKSNKPPANKETSGRKKSSSDMESFSEPDSTVDSTDSTDSVRVPVKEADVKKLQKKKPR